MWKLHSSDVISNIKILFQFNHMHKIIAIKHLFNKFDIIKSEISYSELN